MRYIALAYVCIYIDRTAALTHSLILFTNHKIQLIATEKCTPLSLYIQLHDNELQRATMKLLLLLRFVFLLCCHCGCFVVVVWGFMMIFVFVATLVHFVCALSLPSSPFELDARRVPRYVQQRLNRSQSANFNRIISGLLIMQHNNLFICMRVGDLVGYDKRHIRRMTKKIIAKSKGKANKLGFNCHCVACTFGCKC